MSRTEQRDEVIAKKDEVAAAFRDLVAGAQGLLKATASYTGQEIEGARAKLTEQLNAASTHAKDWEGVAAQKYREATEATQTYVKDNTGTALGLAVLGGMLLGFLTISSRDEDE